MLYSCDAKHMKYPVYSMESRYPVSGIGGKNEDRIRSSHLVPVLCREFVFVMPRHLVQEKGIGDSHASPTLGHHIFLPINVYD